jgi:hypothetical protein
VILASPNDEGPGEPVEGVQNISLVLRDKLMFSAWG